MKKLIILFLLASTLTLWGCQNKSGNNYADDFDSCLDKADKEVINQLTAHFESLLQYHYPNTEISSAYKKYLEAISKMEIQPDFLLNDESLTLVKSIKETKTFNKIWTKLDIETKQNENSKQIVIINKDMTENEPKFEPLAINPNGDFLDCLIKNVENKDFKEILETKKKMPDISNGLVALAMQNSLKKGDYESGLIRTFIAINLYYEYTLNLEKLKISG